MTRMTFDRRTLQAVQSHRQRVKEHHGQGAFLDYGLDDFRRLVRQALRDPCPYCQRQMTDASWSTDHQVPTSRGGSFSIENLVICCKQCNEMKGALTDCEFRELLALLLSWESSQARMDVLGRLRRASILWHSGGRKGGGGSGSRRTG